jgi:serine O-acetyltransferase
VPIRSEGLDQHLVLSSRNLGQELKRWFSCTHLPYDNVDFSDSETPGFHEVLEVFKSDYRRYYPDPAPLLKNVLLRAELQGILLYRLSHYYFNKGNDSADNYAALGRFLSGFELYYSASIGEGFMIVHGMGTVVGARCKIGNNATIYQGVTFGDKHGGRPKLGDHVTVFTGSVIIGDITIGHYATIGANTVCLHDVPDHATVAGNPARIISK